MRKAVLFPSVPCDVSRTGYEHGQEVYWQVHGAYAVSFLVPPGDVARALAAVQASKDSPSDTLVIAVPGMREGEWALVGPMGMYYNAYYLPHQEAPWELGGS